MPAVADEPVLLHEFFERAARLWPERIALDAPPGTERPVRRTLTYDEARRQSDALANLLRDTVVEECVIAILLPRTSPDVYVAQLAVMKAGAAYTCLDPLFPDEQIRDILRDSRAVVLLTDAAGEARVRGAQLDVPYSLDVVAWLALAHDPIESAVPAPWLTPRSLAYLIYTSGTSGRPKGVMIEHAAIANLVRGDLPEFSLTPDDRVAQNSSCAYDSSIEETWLALAAGATLVVVDDTAARLGPDLPAWLRRERISVLCPTPTMLRSMGHIDADANLPDLRLVYVGGEALPSDVAEQWAPGGCLVNGYGPTECAVTSVRGKIEPGEVITIGQPVPGVKAWVLNDALEVVADGQRGELCLGGVALARGYLNDPALTARKFPHHPELGRIYRTGDLVHCDAEGRFHCHGRIDAQVKIRGYRIELEAIEAQLMACAGVREAACKVQGTGPQQKIVAYIIAADAATPPGFDALRSALHLTLPAYMVPSHFGLLARLPTSVGGKLNRAALPVLEVQAPVPNEPILASKDSLEQKLTLAFQKILGTPSRVSTADDFFGGLGGDSLLAAQLISMLRDDPVTSSLTVRDVYEARTAAGLAKLARTAGESRPVLDRESDRPKGHPALATFVQMLWLLLGLIASASLGYLLLFQALPYLTSSFSSLQLLLLTPLLGIGGFLLYSMLTMAAAVLAKKLLIGRYRPMQAPAWGSFYVRNWMVQQIVRLIPWRILEGTVFQHAVLRALGARIGKRVHIHRGVDLLRGGWDLLDIGDDVTLSQEASLLVVEYQDGQVHVGPIFLENGCTLEIRAGVARHSKLEANSRLAALSFLPAHGHIPRGERWDGVPARPAGQASPPPSIPDGARELSPALHGVVLILARMAVGLFLTLPAAALALVFWQFEGMNVEHAGEMLLNPWQDAWPLLLGAGLMVLAVPITLILQAIAMRALGQVQEGVISRWSLAYVRVWLKAGILDAASKWLSGTLFWPVWLRAAGMKIGRGCEISTIIDTVPELVEIGAETFFADGIYLAGPRIQQGTVTLAGVRLGKNTFLGNHAVIAAGQKLPDDILLGVSTVADDTIMRSGTSWFGHSPFELPKREIIEVDRGLTHEPSGIRYVSRMFWELLRFALPLAPMLIAVTWLSVLLHVEATTSLVVLLLVVAPAVELGIVATQCVLVLALKWILLGRVRPGIHPLWSCWCSRWDFLYVAWHYWAHGPLAALEGTLVLNWYLRAMGMKIGRHVLLGSGFAHVVDPDMLEFEDGATVNCQFQAHTFEDRVLKIDYVCIRRNATAGNAAVLLYGADIGEYTTVAEHSVVMKRERLLPRRAYAGCPTRVIS